MGKQKKTGSGENANNDILGDVIEFDQDEDLDYWDEEDEDLFNQAMPTELLEIALSTNISKVTNALELTKLVLTHSSDASRTDDDILELFVKSALTVESQYAMEEFLGDEHE